MVDVAAFVDVCGKRLLFGGDIRAEIYSCNKQVIVNADFAVVVYVTKQAFCLGKYAKRH